MAKAIDEFEPGQRVRVVQQIPQRTEVWTSRLEGTVVRAEQARTGSWFARNKGEKLWLDRLVVEKDDGEIVVCTLDAYSHVELIDPPAQETADDEAEGEGEAVPAAASEPVASES